MTERRGTPEEEQQKQAYRSLIDRSWNRGELSAVAEVMALDYMAVDPDLPRRPGPEGAQHVARALLDAMPDFHYEVEELIAEGELIAARWTISGTVEGTLFGVAGSGRKVRVSGMSFNRFSGGKIVHGWIQWDVYGLLHQLGAVPPLPEL